MQIFENFTRTYFANVVQIIAKIKSRENKYSQKWVPTFTIFISPTPHQLISFNNVFLGAILAVFWILGPKKQWKLMEKIFSWVLEMDQWMGYTFWPNYSMNGCPRWQKWVKRWFFPRFNFHENSWMMYGTIFKDMIRFHQTNPLHPISPIATYLLCWMDPS